jgi:hypothetical protein
MKRTPKMKARRRKVLIRKIRIDVQEYWIYFVVGFILGIGLMLII